MKKNIAIGVLAIATMVFGGMFIVQRGYAEAAVTQAEKFAEMAERDADLAARQVEAANFMADEVRRVKDELDLCKRAQQ